MEELNSIAKVISNNYGTTEEGKINNNTEEINVSINGKTYTLGVGDWTTVKVDEVDYKVRILGFKYDTLTNTNAYGYARKKEGERYKYYVNAKAIYNVANSQIEKNSSYWHLRFLREKRRVLLRC